MVIGVDANIAFMDILGVNSAVDRMVLMPFFHLVLYIVLLFGLLGLLGLLGLFGLFGLFGLLGGACVLV